MRHFFVRIPIVSSCKFQLFPHSPFNVKMATTKICALFEYEFRREIEAAETTRYVNAVFGVNTVNERIMRFSLTTFYDLNINI